ncbi:adenylate cyclase type 8-like, partial, partial [Tachysurus ichikawai]
LEYTARLDFLWRVQAKEEINEMRELREHNENMLRNILPSHVARHFLEKDRDNEVLTHTYPLHTPTVKSCSYFESF